MAGMYIFVWNWPLCLLYKHLSLLPEGLRL
ncbi:hypothetical protein ST616_04624 [Salmonella enterica subsp. enterica serovar Typhisuis]|nr:hypothetical protein C7442_102301 [Salmonella enterica]CAC0117160.1 hypothetical protein SPC668_04673 [Salmonella enterica subsp. enterica serovar Paratyphi C]CAC0117600.1 hypothetical protein ST616_04624 [Salmonella enterica subsp. enterica serovar Typhisuis]SUH63063.1 Uncharacterised protein [Salmonella enterica subsp. enterica serovar Choleraesuis]